MQDNVVSRLRGNLPGVHPGWGRREFTDWRDEQLSWKTTASLGDWSFLWDLEFTGPDMLRLFSEHSINGYDAFSIGQAKHIVQASATGKVIGDGVIMRTGDETFRVQGIPALHSAWLMSRGGYRGEWREMPTFQLQVSGPTALAICLAASSDDLRGVPFMHFAETTIAGVPVRALRQGMAGEVGFEFHGPLAERERVIDALMTAGEPHGLRRIGARTVMINHLEAAFPTGGWHYVKDSYSADIVDSGPWIREHFDTFGLIPTIRGSFDSDEIVDYLQSPVSLGWGRSVRLDHEFTGREAIARELEAPTRLRVTLEFDPDDSAALFASLFDDAPEPFPLFDLPHNERWIAWSDEVLDAGGRRIGLSSTPGYSLMYRRILTLAYLEPASVEPGTPVYVRWGEPGGRQRLIRATVRPAPYKPDNRRADLRAD